ncbi:hypothetical protein [Colwellia sp. 20A7]|uniref:hypothetical protein n=1 Tax=Colwellia sp. 20A7 TaxID=2689569 RepID=UPI00135A91A6|nr:hypothetical protein [Colwellia sp. 20A7]
MRGSSVIGPLLKKHSTAIFLSLLVHVVLLLLLFTAETKQAKQVNITHKAIKSYLYKMTAKVAVKEPILVKEKPSDIKATEQVKLSQAIKKQDEVKSTLKDPLIASSPKKNVNLTANKSQINSSSKAELLVKPVIPSKPKPKVTKKESATPSFSSYQQLQNLRSSLNNKMLTQEFSESQQFRSPSMMHGEQIPVPHSDKQLSEEEIRQKNTARMSNDISITKNDNGTCIIKREQFLGSPVEASTSFFACGESKFDKNFREHMKKVQDKIMPKR